ncbi:hypothetical protein [Methylobacterium sp. Leaf91]|uniref:hypothetical protein n=1 Tax=Methylobacterium sp. Leaf91 TaxID=1736247 RepID=UPI0006F630FF|nr:hypothetical protein [Methylobacterium sp. Leaf91]KQO94634.1 hypothetical protein ASF32_19165 [Methylobacterium sp. Leaf91]
MFALEPWGTTVTASAKQSSSTTRKTATRVAPSTRRNKNIRLAPITARDVEVVEGKGTFRDPYDASTFVTTTVNRRVDVLAAERSAKRITEAQFQVGRMLQAMWEKQLGVRSGGTWDSTMSSTGPGSQVVSHAFTIEDIRMLSRIETAKAVKVMNERAARVIGDSGVRFLRAILAEGQSFSGYVIARGRAPSEKASTDIAKRFRWLLDELTEAQHTARAPAAAIRIDEFADMAGGMPERLKALPPQRSI